MEKLFCDRGFVTEESGKCKNCFILGRKVAQLESGSIGEWKVAQSESGKLFGKFLL